MSSHPSPVLHSQPRKSELIVGFLACTTIAVTTWGFAGRASWAPPVFTALSILTMVVSIVLSWRESKPIGWSQFVPILAFSTLVATSLLNPSHAPDINHQGRWLPQESWISWLPSTVDRESTVKGTLPWISALLLFGAIRRTSFSRKGARLVWAAILIHGGIVALVGIYFHVTAPYEILGFLKDRHGYHFASFVYRNHWAAAVIVMVPMALGFAFSAIGRWKRDRGHFDAVLPGFGIALLLVLTLPIPGSRSGLIICSGILVFALIKFAADVLRSRRAPTNRGKFSLILILSVFILVTGSAGVALN